MEKVINLGIPHIGEQIFESISTDELIKYSMVSETWRVLAEHVLLKRWNGRFFEACQVGKIEIMKLLLERIENIDLNTRDVTGRTALMAACIHGHNDVVQLLLNHSGPEGNIELNAKDDDTKTAFMYACIKGHTDVVQLDTFLLLDYKRVF